MARILNRAPSTISREIERNCGGASYACSFAQQRCVRRRRLVRPGPKLVVGNTLFETVKTMLKLRWSPQQIAARLATLHPDEATQRASHETIYNVIYAQPRGELRREC